MGDEKDWNGSRSAHIVNKKTHVEGGDKKYTSASEWTAYLTNFSGYIDSRTFVLVQNRLDKNRQLGRANAGSKLEEFAGILKCGECGHAIKIYSGDQLSCYGKTSLHICHSRFSSRFFERTFIPKLYLRDIREVVSMEVGKYYSILRMSYQKQHEEYLRLEQKKKELERNRNNLIQALEYSGSEEAQRPILERYRELSKKIADVDIRIANLAEVNLIEIKDNIDYSSLSVERRKSIVNTLIDKIVITDFSSTQPELVASRGKKYGINVIWKHEIDEEYKEIYDKAMANMTDKDKEDHWIETIYGMPHEDFRKIQEELGFVEGRSQTAFNRMGIVAKKTEDKWAADAKKGVIYTVKEGESVMCATPCPELKHGGHCCIYFDYIERNDGSVIVKGAWTFNRYGDRYEDVCVFKSPEYWENHNFISSNELSQFGHEYVHRKAGKDIDIC